MGIRNGLPQNGLKMVPKWSQNGPKVLFGGSFGGPLSEREHSGLAYETLVLFIMPTIRSCSGKLCKKIEHIFYSLL